MDPWKARYARPTAKRTLPRRCEGADIFLGPVRRQRAHARDGRRDGRTPLILALANPDPRSGPSCARPAADAIIATGRRDYPNQVNNVLCFPSSSAAPSTPAPRTINEAMKLASAEALARLARAGTRDVVPPTARAAALRPRLRHPQALRSPPDRRACAGRRPGRHGQRRGHAADRRPRGLSRKPAARADQAGLIMRRSSSARRDPRGWSTPTARRSGCSARSRWWSTRAWPGRS